MNRWTFHLLLIGLASCSSADFRVWGDLRKGQTMEGVSTMARDAEVTLEEGAVDVHFTGPGIDSKQTLRGAPGSASLRVRGSRIERVAVVALEDTRGVKIVMR